MVTGVSRPVLTLDGDDHSFSDRLWNSRGLGPGRVFLFHVDGYLRGEQTAARTAESIGGYSPSLPSP